LEKAPNAKEDGYLEMKNGMIKIIQLWIKNYHTWKSNWHWIRSLGDEKWYD
jgi:hypothetical protein